MKTKTIREVKFTSGAILPKGTELELTFSNHEMHATVDGKRARFTYQTAHQTFKGFKPAPSLTKLEQWMNEGTSRTPLGNITEPDGTDEHGAPSWLLVFGLI